MTEWNWRGARWWKFDLHTHTPASVDYGKGPDQEALKKRSPTEWLLDYMRAGIDCVAVTDHNGGDWVERLAEASMELSEKMPEGFRRIYLFPGMEISVHGGVHLLAILDPSKSASDLDALRGAVGYEGTPGDSTGVTRKTFVEVVDAIVSAPFGGIAIPAHVDDSCGLFTVRGATLQQAIDCAQIFACERRDISSRAPQLYSNRVRGWTELIGSDAHHPNGGQDAHYPGSHFTWIKMGTPSIEGLRLALLDGPLSVRRSDQGGGDPNRHASSILESLEIYGARYMGRSAPFVIGLNPWLNAIIGGRGTGKSTTVETLRLTFRREDELPEELLPDFEKYGQVYESRDDTGLLTDEATVKVIYRKNGTRYCVQWSPDGELDPILEDQNGEWKHAEGEIRQRFPVRIYSQKQIFQLAKTPLALLKVVNEAPEVDYSSYAERWKDEESRFLSLRAKTREIEAGLSEEPRLRGELDDIKRKLSIYEEAGNADILKAFQGRRRQQQAVQTWEEDWQDIGDRLRGVASEIEPDELDEAAFNSRASEDQELIGRVASIRDRLKGIQKSLEVLGGEADEVWTDWQEMKSGSKWREMCDATTQEYEGLQSKLSAEGADDPAAYGEYVQRRQVIEQRLKELADRRLQIDELSKQGAESLKRLIGIRRELTNLRRAFLESVLEGNRYVRIRVVPYGARETIEAEFRSFVQRESGGFEKDIGFPDGDGLLGQIYRNAEDADEVERNLWQVKDTLHKIVLDQHDPSSIADKRFAAHVARLTPETLDRIDLWIPEDSLDVQYSVSGDGRQFRSIQEGSPGQKTAALLAFLLSYGEEPLILDQPEDDLDNHLIYELIVTQLREAKRQRQIIVVSHNANIVVNGDAELVVALAARQGESRKECDGSLQEKLVRDTICDIMEGGRAAFDQRYHRIALESTDV